MPEPLLRAVPLNQLKAGPYQPRTRMDPVSLGELADSIRAQGLVQPIIVRPVSSAQAPPVLFEIIAGERRFRAASLAGLDRVPCLIRAIPDAKAMVFSLIENIQRENLNPMEEAMGFKRLIDEFGMTHEAVAKAVGRSRPVVTNLLRLLQLAPPVQAWVLSDALEMGHARSLVALEAAQQILLGHRILAEGLSVRDTEKAVTALLADAAFPKGKAPTPPLRNRDWLRLEEGLADTLGVSVQLRANRKGAGQLVLRFGSLDELDALLHRLGHDTEDAA